MAEVRYRAKLSDVEQVVSVPKEALEVMVAAVNVLKGGLLEKSTGSDCSALEEPLPPDPPELPLFDLTALFWGDKERAGSLETDP